MIQYVYCSLTAVTLHSLKMLESRQIQAETAPLRFQLLYVSTVFLVVGLFWVAQDFSLQFLLFQNQTSRGPTGTNEPFP